MVKVQRCLPPSITIFVPVENRNNVAHASIAAATSSGAPILFNGVEDPVFSLKSDPRPGTNPESITPGETQRTRIDGANTFANDSLTISKLAFAATYAKLLPTPVKAAIDETFTTKPSPLDRNIDSNARIDANTPRKFACSTSSIRSSVKASKSPAGTGLVKPAELIKISQRPNCSRISSAALRKVLDSVMEALMQICPPSE